MGPADIDMSCKRNTAEKSAQLIGLVRAGERAKRAEGSGAGSGHFLEQGISFVNHSHSRFLSCSLLNTGFEALLAVLESYSVC